jgi:hypothetical protein
VFCDYGSHFSFRAQTSARGEQSLKTSMLKEKSLSMCHTRLIRSILQRQLIQTKIRQQLLELHVPFLKLPEGRTPS